MIATAVVVVACVAAVTLPDVNFVQSENQTAIITSLPKVMQALEGNAGTIVHF